MQPQSKVPHLITKTKPRSFHVLHIVYRLEQVSSSPHVFQSNKRDPDPHCKPAFYSINQEDEFSLNMAKEFIINGLITTTE